MDADDDAIAIIGVGGRFPGANDLEEFWRVLENGENHLVEIPEERWKNEAFYDENKDALGKSYVKRAAFTPNHDAWDNKLYWVNDMEASRMDPQQYMVLDASYMALENAGYTRDAVSGSLTGVYIGVMNDDYSGIQNADLTTANNYSPTGVSTSICANRISYIFNLQGPSLCVDTACSSSLVAVHLGIQAIKSGECSMALCGGCNVIMCPENFVLLSRARMCSPTGYCQAFSANADGYARGEGCGMVLLKSYKQALQDKDNIWAVIATALNQDGHMATPISAPSAIQQEVLLKRIYSMYNVDPKELQYIEAHGTGTPIGDPIEVNALGKVLGKVRLPEQEECFVGSVKTNIGHLESAAGIAGLVKVLLMMKNNKIVKSLHYDVENSNPRINFKAIRMQVPTENVDWTLGDKGYRLASVNSFGFGGTNSHAIVKEIINIQNAPETSEPKVITVSAQSLNSLQESTKHFVAKLKTGTYKLGDVAFTSTAKRSHYNYRIAKTASTMDELVEKMSAAAEYPPQNPSIDSRDKHVIFIFCGMGTLWEGMCVELLEKERVFASKLKEIDGYLFDLANWSIIEKLQAKEGFEDPAVAQPLIFACQVALAALWESWGIKAEAIVGHSVGEVAAAHVSGALSLRGAVEIIYHRGRLQSEVTGGKMLVIGKYPVESVKGLLEKYPGKANIAAYNSATSCTISGDDDVIDEIRVHYENENESRKDKMFIRELQVTSAYHSHHMQPIFEPLVTALKEIEGEYPSIPIYSTVTGELADDSDYVSGEYWAKNVRQPVLFDQALGHALKEHDHNILIEIGPKPALRANIREIAGNIGHNTVPSMKQSSEKACIIQSLAELYTLGINPDWGSFYSGQESTPVDIPRYQFSRMKNLFEPEKSLLQRQGITSGSGTAHPFVEGIPGKDHEFKAIISKDTTPFIYEHAVQGTILVPGVTHVELAMASYLCMTQNRMPTDHLRLSVDFSTPIVIMSDDPVEVKIVLEEHKGDNYSNAVTNRKVVEGDSKDRVKLTPSLKMFTFTVASGRQVHARGMILEEEYQTYVKKIDIEAIKRRCFVRTTPEDIYETLEKYGFKYGSSLKALKFGVRNCEEYLAELEIPETLVDQVYKTTIHPALLDNLLQMGGMLGAMERDQMMKEGIAHVEDEEGGQHLPRGIGSVIVRHPPKKKCYAYMQKLRFTNNEVRTNSLIVDLNGEVLVELRDVVSKAITKTKSVEDSLTYKINWKVVQLQETKETSNEVEGKEAPSLNEPESELNEGRPTTIGYKPKTLVFCNAGDPWEILVEYVSPDSVFIDKSECCIDDLLTDEDTVLNLLSEKIPDLKSFELIIFTWGMFEKCRQFSTRDIDDKIQYGSASFRQLVKTLHAKELIIPMLVVTSGTQTINRSNSSTSEIPRFKQNVNLIGAQLWGSVRCLLKEFTYNSVKLVDLHNGSENEFVTLGSYLNHLIETEYCEILINEDTLYSNEILFHFGKKNAIHRRENSTYPGCHVRLVSASSDYYKELQFRYLESNAQIKQRLLDEAKIAQENSLSDPENRKATSVNALPNVPQVPEGHLMVCVDSAALHNKAFFPVTKSQMDHSATYWPEDELNGHDVISLDVVGEVISAGKKSEFLLGDKVVICMPTVIRTWITVPEYAVIKLKALPKPVVAPLVSRMLLVWYILKQFKREREQCVVIPKTEDSRLAHLICQQTTSPKNPSALVLPHEVHQNELVKNKRMVVLMADLDERAVGYLVNNLHHKAKVLVISEWVSGSTLSLIRRFHPGLPVDSLRLLDFYTPVMLKSIMPKFVESIKVFSKLKHTDIPMQEVNLEFKTRKHVSNTCKATDSDLLEDEGQSPDSRTVRVLKLRSEGGRELILPVMAAREELYRADCGYMLIGGLSGLGWEIVRVMAEAGAGYIFPLSRRSPSEELQEEIEEIEETYGCKIICLKSDVSDFETLKEAFEEMDRQMPGIPLKGVFHGGAVLEDALTTNMRQEQFKRVTDSKIIGSLNLHELTKGRDLDYFMMHSSTASVLGNAGQSNYAAGNSFKDAFATYRREQGLAGQTYNWSALAIGMLKDNEVLRGKLASQGYPALDIPHTLRCFEQGLLLNEPQIVFGEFTWQKITTDLMRPELEHLRSRYKRLISMFYVERKSGRGGAAGLLQVSLEELLKMSPDDRAPIIMKYVRLLLSEMFATEPSFIKDDSLVRELGLDSMMAMTLISQVQKDLKVKIPVVILIGQDTTTLTLATYCNEHLGLEESEDDDAIPGEQELDYDPKIPSLAPTQLPFWYKYLENPGDYSVLHVSPVQNVNPMCDYEFILQVFSDLFKRFPALRINYVPNEKARYGVEAVTHSSHNFKPNVYAYEVRTVEEAERYLTECIKIPWDFSKESTLRIAVLKRGMDVKYFVFIFHHIIFDMINIGRILQDFPVIASALSERRNPPKAFQTTQGHEYSLAYERHLSYRTKDLKEFWSQKMVDVTTDVRIPTCLERPESKGLAGGHIRKQLDASFMESLQTFCRTRQITMFQLILSTYNLLLYKYTKLKKITINTIVDIRFYLQDFANVMTNCANHIPLVSLLEDEDLTFVEYLESNAKNISETLDHGSYPWHTLKSEIMPVDEGTSFGVNHIFVMKDVSDFGAMFEIGEEWGAKFYETRQLGCFWDTRMAIWKYSKDAEYQLEFCHNYDVLTSNEAEIVCQDFMNLLINCMENPNGLLSDMEPPSLLEYVAKKSIIEAVRPDDAVLVSLKRRGEGNELVSSGGQNYWRNVDLAAATDNPPPYALLDQQEEHRVRKTMLNKKLYQTYMLRIKRELGDEATDKIKISEEMKYILSCIPYSPTVLKMQRFAPMTMINKSGKKHKVYMRLFLPKKPLDKPDGIKFSWSFDNKVYRKNIKMSKVKSFNCYKDEVTGETSFVFMMKKKPMTFITQDPDIGQAWNYGFQEILEPEVEETWM